MQRRVYCVGLRKHVEADIDDIVPITGKRGTKYQCIGRYSENGKDYVVKSWVPKADYEAMHGSVDIVAAEEFNGADVEAAEPLAADPVADSPVAEDSSEPLEVAPADKSYFLSESVVLSAIKEMAAEDVESYDAEDVDPDLDDALYSKNKAFCDTCDKYVDFAECTMGKSGYAICNDCSEKETYDCISCGEEIDAEDGHELVGEFQEKCCLPCVNSAFGAEQTFEAQTKQDSDQKSERIAMSLIKNNYGFKRIVSGPTYYRFVGGTSSKFLLFAVVERNNGTFQAVNVYGRRGGGSPSIWSSDPYLTQREAERVSLSKQRKKERKGYVFLDAEEFGAFMAEHFDNDIYFSEEDHTSCPKCGYEPPVFEVGQEMDDGSIIETEDEASEESIFWLYENHPDYCPNGWNPDYEAEDSETLKSSESKDSYMSEVWVVELADQDGFRDAEFLGSSDDAQAYHDWVVEQDAGMTPVEINHIKDEQVLTLEKAKERFVNEYMWDPDDEDDEYGETPVLNTVDFPGCVHKAPGYYCGNPSCIEFGLMPYKQVEGMGILSGDNATDHISGDFEWDGYSLQLIVGGVWQDDILDISATHPRKPLGNDQLEFINAMVYNLPHPTISSDELAAMNWFWADNVMRALSHDYSDENHKTLNSSESIDNYMSESPFKICHEDCGWGSGRTSSKDVQCTSQDPTCGLCNFHPVDDWIEFTHKCINGHPVCNRCFFGGHTEKDGKIIGDGAGNPCRHCKTDESPVDQRLIDMANAAHSWGQPLAYEDYHDSVFEEHTMDLDTESYWEAIHAAQSLQEDIWSAGMAALGLKTSDEDPSDLGGPEDFSADASIDLADGKITILEEGVKSGSSKKLLLGVILVAGLTAAYKNSDAVLEFFEGLTGDEADPIPGCMDSTANNYDATATEDNGSCTYDADDQTTA